MNAEDYFPEGLSVIHPDDTHGDVRSASEVGCGSKLSNEMFLFRMRRSSQLLFIVTFATKA